MYGSLGGSTVALVTAPGANSVTDAAPVAAAPPAASDPDAPARRDFDLANLVGTAQAWDAFLVRHPSGFFADLARQQRAKLATPGAVAALPPADADKPAASRSLGRFGGMTVEVGGRRSHPGDQATAEQSGRFTAPLRSTSRMAANCRPESFRSRSIPR